uniref:Nuclear protein localization protein 4-like protein n=1 Tax=Strongyloides papillosus TaxID=174720 RepID=A0A0N5BN02_STREA
MVLQAHDTNPFSTVDSVDAILAKEDGKIERGRTPNCLHGVRQRCSNCLPIDPYDPEYLKEKEIKHMSLHSYIRKLTDGGGRSTKSLKVLEEINCKLDVNCDAGHKPYPKGICTKCRPSTLTLNRQVYRHVDNISIENDYVANQFLNFWRKSGIQRVGYLIGVYEPFSEVPLGIKARVCAIYEPPQHGTPESVEFDDDTHEHEVNELCKMLNLKKIGWIVTDLWSKNPTDGTVHCIRHPESFLVSAEECITAGYLQSKHKNKSEYSTSGYFGSKFVTLIVSGDQTNQIHFSGYQVSEQCTALVEANILCPTSHPELAYIRDKPLSETHFITEVQFVQKNEYGAEVHKDGKPLPVEFLLVDVPAGMPKSPEFTFHVPKDGQLDFPIENRLVIGETYDITQIANVIHSYGEDKLLELSTNFHFLIFLMTNDVLKLSMDEMKEVCSYVVKQDREGIKAFYDNNANFKTLMELCSQSQGGGSSPNQSNSNNGSGSGSGLWNCQYCTYENTGNSNDCAICGLPR